MLKRRYPAGMVSSMPLPRSPVPPVMRIVLAADLAIPADNFAIICSIIEQYIVFSVPLSIFKHFLVGRRAAPQAG
jgi:hypothetical protein